MDVYFTLKLLTLISQCKIAEITILIMLFLDFSTKSFWFRLQWCVDSQSGVAFISSAKLSELSRDYSENLQSVGNPSSTEKKEDMLSEGYLDPEGLNFKNLKHLEELENRLNTPFDLDKDIDLDETIGTLLLLLDYNYFVLEKRE